MSSVARKSSASADNAGTGRKGQVELAKLQFAERLNSAITVKGVTNAELAKAAGLERQRIHEYREGQKLPGADSVFSIADALAVNARWLVRGEGARTKERTAEDQEAADWIRLPRLDLFRFEDGQPPEPLEMFPVRRDWLAAVTRASPALWLADLPSDAMPDIGREGDAIVCRGPDSPLADGRVYVFLLDGRPIVRRVQLRPEGLVLKASDPSIDPITISPDRLDQLVPIGRVLAALSMHLV